MLVGSACMVINDALIKLATQSIPVSQVIFVQGLCMMILLVAIAVAMRIPLRANFFTDRIVLLRSALNAPGLFTFVAALKHMPLANAIAIGMATPLMASLLAVFIFNEKVSGARWLAMTAGLAGTLLIVQPASDEFNAWSLVVLVGSFFGACRDVATRSVRKDIPSLVLTIGAVVVMTMCAGAGGLAEDWRLLSLPQIAVLAAASAFLCSSFFLATVAMREGEFAVLGPIRYSTLIFGALLGYGIWGDIPGFVALCGMVLTVLAGLCLVRLR
ncbi:DMT family transporter [Caenimonas soli]|uniref:DMT family transporter n=1 Tax=Caenimonas soli TaxID=2735555 RepID=UPI001F1F13D5|nr:DMT family transporter [Caenimonas soli]NPC57765.1 DMT family transporter [Caenimonas soli]